MHYLFKKYLFYYRQKNVTLQGINKKKIDYTIYRVQN